MPRGFLVISLLQSLFFIALCLLAAAGLNSHGFAVLLPITILAQGVGIVGMLSLSLARELVRSSRSRAMLAIVLGLVISCLLAFSLVRWARPSETLQSNMDEGMYVSAASHLARTGRLRMDVDFSRVAPIKRWLVSDEIAMAQRGNAPAPTHPSFAVGFLFDSRGKDTVAIQFPPGYPVLLASFRQLGGWWFMQRANWICLATAAGLLGLLIVRRQPFLLVIAVSVFVLNPLTVWIANRFFSEVWLLQFWLTALYCWHLRRFQPLLAGITVGSILAGTLLIKLDALLLIPLSLLAICLSLRNRSPFYRGWTFSFIPLAAVAGSTLFYLNPAYYSDTLEALTAGRWSWLAILATVTVAGVIAFTYTIHRARLLDADWAWAAKMGGSVAAAFVVGFSAYNLWIRPNTAKPDSFQFPATGTEIRSYREETMLRLQWYWTPLGLVVATVGLAQACRSTPPGARLALLAVGITAFVVLCFDIRCNPLQPYCMRRLFPFATPAIIFGIVAAVVWLRQRVRTPRLATLATALVSSYIVFFEVKQNTSLNSVAASEGLSAALSDFATRIPAKAILLVRADSPLGALAAPLRFIHDYEVFLLRVEKHSTEYQHQMKKWLKHMASSQQSVLFLGANARENGGLSNVTATALDLAEWKTRNIPTSYDQLITQPITKNWEVYLVKVRVRPSNDIRLGRELLLPR